MHRSLWGSSPSRRFSTLQVAKTLGLSCALLLSLASPTAHAQQDPEPARGPFWSGTIMRAKNQAAAMKGLAITLGPDRKNYVTYDLDTLRLAVAWSGPFLEFGNTLTKIEWPPPPSVKGTVAFETENGAGWANPSAGSLADPRDRSQGPLPKPWAHYLGAYLHGDTVVLQYSLGAGRVLESPSVETLDGSPVFIRSFQFDRARSDATLYVLSATNSTLESVQGITIVRTGGVPTYALKFVGAKNPSFEIQEGKVLAKFGRTPKNKSVHLAIARLSPNTSQPASAFANYNPPTSDLRKLTRGGPAHWPDLLETQGKLGADDGPYAVDTITEPFPNKYNTRTFFGGFDFLPDGRAVICTFHGDVWLVSGIDASLSKLSWKRFATGLFQPLGVKVKDGKIYVAGRDQITRLHDLNRDGEADYYENFNNDTVVTPNYHEFVLDLHTDSKGNFYYAKGAPWEPSAQSPHQGTILKVSPDGSRLEVFASGLRAPNGMTVGPDDTVLVGDNQGHWMPSSKVNVVKQGAFLGMVPTAQRELTLRYPDGREIRLNPSDPEARKRNSLKGWDKEMPIPASYDEPAAWLPMRWDNSSGGQVYVTSDRWGPWKGSPLFMSYGKCLLYGMMMDEVDGASQAALVPFGLKFQSGIMRGRFNQKDGQLYLCGLKGWQTSAIRDGGFYRVRYTGKPVRTPVATRTASNGIELTFPIALDPKSASDPENFAVELWNYKYSGAYGSPEFSVANPAKTGHDKLAVKSTRLSPDGKRLFLEIDGLKKADQYSIRYTLTGADGAPAQSEVIGTLHKLRPSLQ